MSDTPTPPAGSGPPSSKANPDSSEGQQEQTRADPRTDGPASSKAAPDSLEGQQEQTRADPRADGPPSSKAAPDRSPAGQQEQTRAAPLVDGPPSSLKTAPARSSGGRHERTRADPQTDGSASSRLAPIERPRERLLVLGSTSLADVELLALVLGGGHAIERATLLLRTLGGLQGLARALPQELLRVPGIGEASATSIAAALELTRRLGRLNLPCRQALRDAHALRRFARAALRGAEQEVFMVIGLDARLRVQIVREVGLGTVAAVTVHPREVFRPLVRAGAHSTLLVHNHPSGDPKPSQADIELTERLVDVGWLLGVPVLDHLIVSDGGETSLVESGMMPHPTGIRDLSGAGAQGTTPEPVDKPHRSPTSPSAQIHDRGPI